MKKGLTELVFILDKSGSMSGLESDTIGGFNSMLKKQQELDGECRITTVLFDNDYELLHDRVDVNALSPMTENEYRVGGSTALIDAIGRTMDKIIRVQKSVSEEYRAEKVVFVIITDGMENSSREYSSAKVKKMIEHETEKYGWEFMFLGANIDAVETGSRLGIRKERAVEYVSDSIGTANTYCVVNEAISQLRCCGKISEDAMAPVRADTAKRGKRKIKLGF
ncbi:MAG: VWA domain-containing protein [Oscillospiraceae bacterium]|nr:VWA domain-containing protein [Oscillospiraceae bacterium]